MTTKEKLDLLRNRMAEENVDAFIVFSADPHMSEYLPEEWQERSWISGFTGSAGFVVIARDRAALWTDGRYFTQAPLELEGSGIELMKDGVEGTPDYISWLKEIVPEGGTVAVNGVATSNSNWEALTTGLQGKNISVVNKPLLESVWQNRVDAPAKNPVFVHPLERAGLSAADKLAAIRQEMEKKNASVHIMSALDEVAWTLNLRGSDVFANPVFISYLIVTKNDAILFVDLEKLTPLARLQLDEAWVKMRPYKDFFKFLEDYSSETVLLAPNTNQSIFEVVKDKNSFIKSASPAQLMKAQKNETELDGFRKVMQRDGVALVKFFHWLQQAVGKEDIDEYSIGEKLRDFRAEGENFVGESFNSIIGYLENGAIIHYSAKNSGSKKVTDSGSLLVDSGGQYLEGTTDVTRTVALGAVSDQFRKDCTLVLKGMIQLSLAKFPRGTRGVQLDAIARQPLWKEGKDYNHGTGHGVGSFMNVHEGPQNIRKDMNPQELLPGMVCSNEPGFYIEGQYGIRHENLVAVVEDRKTDFGTFYKFETLTVCPFDLNALEPSLLTEEEKTWLNDYHQWCSDLLLPHLEGDVKDWFTDQIKPVE